MLGLLACANPCDRGEARFSFDRPGFPRTLHPGENTLWVRAGGEGITPAQLLGTTWDGGETRVFSRALGGDAVCDGTFWREEATVTVDTLPSRCMRADLTLVYDDDGFAVDLRSIRNLPLNTHYGEVWELCP